MSEATESFRKAGFWIAFSLLVTLPISVFWGGFVLATVWGWFVVPIFGVKALTYAQAAGLKLVVYYVTFQMDESKSAQRDRSGVETVLTSLGTVVLIPALALLNGWIIKELFL